MRFPWWPIYIDAQFDKHGVRYALDGQPEEHVPWCRVRRLYDSGRRVTLWCEDEHGKRLRAGRSPLVIRVDTTDYPEDQSDARAVQHAAITDPDSEFVCVQDWTGDERSMLFQYLLLLVCTIGLPAWYIVFCVREYGLVPGNILGTRFQNGIVVSAVAFGLIALYVLWRSTRSIVADRRALRVIQVDHLGVLAEDCQKNQTRHAWSSLRHVRSGFTSPAITTVNGERLRYRLDSCVGKVLYKRVRYTRLLDFKLLLVFCLIWSLAAGPIFWYSSEYLIPDHELTVGSAWYVSLMPPVGTLLTACSIRLFSISEKRRQAKNA